MTVPLVRRSTPGLDPSDPDAPRAWLLPLVRDEILLRGQPHPRIWLFGRGHVDTLDLDAVGRADPEAHVGATFQALRLRPATVRCLLVVQMSGRDPEGGERQWALVFEEREEAGVRRWWMALLEYASDPRTGAGRTAPDWTIPPGETSDPTDLPRILAAVVAPPAGARAAGVAASAPAPRSDVRFASGELQPHHALPADAAEMLQFAEALGVHAALLAGRVRGPVVVKLAGRAWEQWALGDDPPASDDEMIRWIANHRPPPADAVALVQLAVRAQDDPRVPGVQGIAELGGSYVQTWAPVVEGPEGVTAPEVHWWPARPVPDEGLWLGVPSRALLAEEPMAEA